MFFNPKNVLMNILTLIFMGLFFHLSVVFTAIPTIINQFNSRILEIVSSAVIVTLSYSLYAPFQTLNVHISPLILSVLISMILPIFYKVKTTGTLYWFIFWSGIFIIGTNENYFLRLVPCFLFYYIFFIKPKGLLHCINLTVQTLIFFLFLTQRIVSDNNT